MTAGAHFRIDQSTNPIPTGTTDVARTDLRAAPFHLIGDSSTGQGSPVWTCVAWPPESEEPQPTSPHSFDATFTPDAGGTYRFTYTVNGGGGINSRNFIVAVTATATGLIIDDGLREPGFLEEGSDDNSGGNARGWAPAYEAGMGRYIPGVATMAALRTRVPNRQKQVQLLGRDSIGDGGGGLLFWDAASTTADDGGTCFQPGFGTGAALGTGRWRRQYSGAVQAAWFGAKSDRRQVTDAAITTGLKQLTSATAAFTAADVGRSVVLQGAVAFTCTGTVAVAAGTRKLLGTGTKFLEDLWIGAPFKIGATSYVLSDKLTGTVATTKGSGTVTGTGTKFQDEIRDGDEIWIHGIRYKVSGAPGSQTSLTLAIAAVESGSGVDAYMRVTNTHALLDITAAGTLTGQTFTGPPGALVSKIDTVTNGTTAQLHDAATATVVGGTCNMGTDNVPALTAAEAVADHVVVAPGSYLLATKFRYTRPRVHMELLKGAKLYLGDTWVIDNKNCLLWGYNAGVDFTGNGPYQPNFLWVGSPNRPIIKMADVTTDWASGALVRGIFCDSNGVDGMTGFLVGEDTIDCSGIRFYDCLTVDMYIGMNVRAGAQQNFYHDVSHYRRTPDTFSMGYGLLVNGDTLVGTAAITANFFHGGTIQQFRTAIQSGGPSGNGPAVVSFENMILEGFPPANGCAIRLYNGGVYHISKMYTEAFGEGSNTGIELGAPNNQVAQKVSIGPHVYLPGYRNAIVAYGFDGLEVRGNSIDISGSYTPFKSSALKNVGGGLTRRDGKWLTQAKVAPGADSEALEVPDQTGFQVVGTDNVDTNNVQHPRWDYNCAVHVDTLDGNKTIGGTTKVFGQWLVGDDTTSTTVNADSNAGQKILGVASSVNFLPGQTINVEGAAHARQETPIVDYVVDSTHIACKSNLINTHTAVQADVVTVAPPTVNSFGNHTFSGVDGGGGHTIALDNGFALIRAKHDSTAAVGGHFVALELLGNSRDTTGGGANRNETLVCFGTHADGTNYNFFYEWQVNGLPVVRMGRVGGAAVTGWFGAQSVQRTLTDSTGGSATTTLKAVTSNADANDNFATIRAALAAYGIVV